MNQLFDAAMEFQSFCTQQHWRFCIIGGIAVARWGQPRATQDVDGVIVRQTDCFDWDYAVKQLSLLSSLSENDEPLKRLIELREKSL